LLAINVQSEIIGKNNLLVHLYLVFGIAISWKLEQTQKYIIMTCHARSLIPVPTCDKSHHHHYLGPIWLVSSLNRKTNYFGDTLASGSVGSIPKKLSLA